MTRKQQQLAGKGTTAGSMLCFTVSMLRARLSNCAADKNAIVWTQNILSVFMCGRKTFVAFSNLSGIVWTRPRRTFSVLIWSPTRHCCGRVKWNVLESSGLFCGFKLVYN